MELDIEKEVAELRRLSVRKLRTKFAQICGETTSANNKQWLVKRIIWRLQCRAQGGLSERALRRADELAQDSDLRSTAPPELRIADEPKPAPKPVLPPKPVETALPARAQDERLPPAGSVLTRAYKGGTVQVRVLEHGFEYEGRVYASLSAAAKAITGSHCNGFLFFRGALGTKGGER